MIDQPDYFSSISLLDDYYLNLFGGDRFIATPHSNESEYRISEIDSINSYRGNLEGYRSDQFTQNADLLLAGCSYTYGTGVPESARWGDLFASSIGKHPYTLARPGMSIGSIVEELFLYFRVYGNPKNLVVLFPDPFRLKTPVDGDLITLNEADGRGEYGTISDGDPRKKFTTVATNYSYSYNSGISIIKRPFNVEVISGMDTAVYESIRSIRYLEQYCLASNIKLMWATWRDDFNTFISDNQNTLKFKYYVELPIREINQTANHADCHVDLLEKYPEMFYQAADIYHPGTHQHAHFAREFLAKIL